MNDFINSLFNDTHVKLTCEHKDNGIVKVNIDMKGITPLLEEYLYNIFMGIYEKEPSLYIDVTERVLKDLKDLKK